MIQDLSYASVSYDRAASQSLLGYANKNRNEGFFNDVTLKVGTDIFPANRMVLSCYSVVFERMFKAAMKERHEETIEVKSVNADAMKILLDFIYTGHIEINTQTVMDLIAASDYLQLEGIKEYCFEYLISILEPSSWFAIRSAADLYRDASLKRHLRWYTSTNLEEIAQLREFKAMTKEELTSVITELYRDQVEEQTVYEAILSWTKDDEMVRKEDFASLLQLVKLNKLTGHFIDEVVAKETIVNEDNKCLILVMKAFSDVLKAPQNLSKILCFGGEHTSKRCFEVFNSSGAASDQYPNLPVPLCNHMSLRVDNFIYCVGGTKERCSSDGVFRLSTSSNELQQWEAVALLPEPLHSFGAVAYCDFLIVAGGLADKTVANVHYYDSTLDEWKKLASLNEKRFACALVCCNSGVYALGGFGQGGELSSVEFLPHLNGKWKNVAPMLTPRKRFAAVHVNKQIFALGGKRGTANTSRLSSVEKYDPEYDMWTSVRSMLSERSALSACVMHGKIYVVGGFGVNQVTKIIECYDPIEEEWSVVGETSEKLVYHSVLKM